MRTYTVNGIRVFDYAGKEDDPVLRPIVEQPSPVAPPPVQLTKEQTMRKILEEDAATYNWDNLNEKIVELTRANAEVHKIAEELLHRHEAPYYHYCATGHSGRDFTEYQAGTEWSQRREFLSNLVRSTERQEHWTKLTPKPEPVAEVRWWRKIWTR